MELRPSAPSRPPNPALPYREDCWSEGETEVLINAWGDRYVEVNRGSLRQKQWQEVADAVNSRPCDARRPPRTDVQCKNRVDTLKKKYKSERAKMAADGSSSIRSPWKFFDQMDYLIGSFVPPTMAAKKSSSSSLPLPPLMLNSSPPMALPLPPNRKQPFPLPTASAVRVDPRRNYSDDYGSDPSSESEARDRSGRRVRRKREVESRGSGDDGIRGLSRAIARLAEIYESVEEEKQRHMMELEKQRMEFAKELEFQRMQMFADSQVQLVKMNKRSRRGGAGGGGGSGSGDGGENGSAALLPFLLQPVLL